MLRPSASILRRARVAVNRLSNRRELPVVDVGYRALGKSTLLDELERHDSTSSTSAFSRVSSDFLLKRRSCRRVALGQKLGAVRAQFGQELVEVGGEAIEVVGQ